MLLTLLSLSHGLHVSLMGLYSWSALKYLCLHALLWMGIITSCMHSQQLRTFKTLPDRWVFSSSMPCTRHLGFHPQNACILLLTQSYLRVKTWWFDMTKIFFPFPAFPFYTFIGIVTPRHSLHSFLDWNPFLTNTVASLTGANWELHQADLSN